MVNGDNCLDTVTDRRAWARATLGMAPHEARFKTIRETENMSKKTEPVMAPKIQPGIGRAIEAFNLLWDPISRPSREEYEDILKDEKIPYSPFASNLQKWMKQFSPYFYTEMVLDNVYDHEEQVNVNGINYENELEETYRVTFHSKAEYGIKLQVLIYWRLLRTGDTFDVNCIVNSIGDDRKGSACLLEHDRSPEDIRRWVAWLLSTVGEYATPV